ncbi:phosphotransferase [Streptomyces sp. SAI-229]|uniref:phosphotransferase n=1 Tax=Streptomyces sp. SAI-229 TaxID=3377731 RepID=UPI003C7AF4F2
MHAYGESRTGGPGAQDIDHVIPFLLDLGLLSEEDFLAGGVAVETLPHRNRNNRVMVTEKTGFFLKQPETLAEGSCRTLRREAEFFHRQLSCGSPLADSLPRLLAYEPTIPALVFELLPEHHTLEEFCTWSHGHYGFPIHTWRELGRRLSRIHETLRLDFRREPERAPLPWIVRAAVPSPYSLVKLSPADLDVLRIVQSSHAIRNCLRSIGELWEPDTVIHGDIRANNILVHSEGSSAEDVRFIDWEMCQVGDRFWDIASFFEVLVRFWLSGLLSPPQGEMPEIPQWPPSQAVFQATGRAFWQGYFTPQGHDAGRSQPDAAKMVRLCGARMVQSAFEMTAGAADIPSSAVLLLQFCENALMDPHKAASELFAIG